MSFEGKLVWIVGASSGIGEGLALEFSKLKARLVLSSRNTEKLERLKSTCLSLGAADCKVVRLDLEQNADYSSQVDQVLQANHTIDYLIVNGGISQRSLVHETGMDIDRKLMEINYFGNIAITKAVLPQMLKQKEGHIVTVSSIVGIFGFPLRSAYSASKHALHGFYETLRAEHKKDNIKVTIAIPGRVQTNISYHALKKDGKEHQELDKGQATGISSEACAKKMIKAIKKEKKEVLIGGKELIMVWIRRFLPALFYNIVNKIESK
jgi:short-subunit dehydrogenase